MKKLLLLLILVPTFGLAQLNYKDLSFLANNKIDKNIEYIKNQGYTFRQEKTASDGTKQVYYEKGKLNSTMVVMRILSNSNVVISYVPEDKKNFVSIKKEILNKKYTLINSTSTNRDKCTKFQSKEYFSKLCEIIFPNESNVAYNITFYKNNVDLKD